ncbi:MAG: right-handed parallel beta-helix repeat-containing protein [Bacteroidales bacterium]|nr:right-handed parallel beta-helix repeat-containing protein [Bacteroidales bacterium]
MRLRLFLSLLSVWICVTARTEPVSIRIDDQASFDSLGREIRVCLAGGAEEVEVSLGPGPFFFREGHLSLDDIDAPGKTVRITGDGTELLPVMDWRPYDPEVCRYGVDLRPLPEAREMKRARFFVRVIHRKQGICRIRTDREQDPSLAENGFIYLTEWFRGKTYKITAVKGKDVYFQVDDLRPKRLLFNVNLDWTFSLQFPRYCLLNAPESLTAQAGTFLSVRRCKLASLALSGVRFTGNARPAGSRKGLIDIDSTRADVSIAGCRFEQIHSDCITVSGSDAVTVEDCSFLDCSRGCLHADNGSYRTAFLHCRVHSSGLSGDNEVCVLCYGANFRICDNTFSDYGYCAVRTGIHYSAERTGTLSGTITHNEFFQTPAYFAAAPLTGLMDSGAIYVSTQIDSLLIEGNQIHDINGPTYNRGIFVDDGGSHIRIVGNTIRGIANYYAIDIDPRSAWKMLHRRKRRVDVANEDVVIRDNIVDGRVRIAKMRKRTRRLLD